MAASATPKTEVRGLDRLSDGVLYKFLKFPCFFSEIRYFFDNIFVAQSVNLSLIFKNQASQ
jgi:hypothetical protein